MNWEAVGAIGEVVGAVAVVITLAYLAIQIRQNTATQKAASHHAITDSFNNITVQIARDPQMGRLWRLGMEDLSNLSDDERVSFSFMAIAYMRVFETLYYQQKIGTLEEQLYVAEENTLKRTFVNRGLQDWWYSNTISFSE